MNTRASRYGNGARIAYHLTQAALPRSSHRKRPHHYTLPQVAACVLLMVSRDRSSSDMAAWLLTTDQVRQALELTKVPDPTTLQRTVKQVRMVDVEKMKNRLLDEQGVDEESVATDRTGCSPGQASLYYLTRNGRRSHRWAKGVYAVGTRSQGILAWRSGWGPGSDGPDVSGLRRDARRYGRSRGRRTAWVILADAGCDGHAVRADALVPPVLRGGHLVHPERSARADRVAHAHPDGLFGQRWKSETVPAVIKRTVGDTLRARTHSRQRREPIIKGLVYTIHRYLRLDVSDRCNKALAKDCNKMKRSSCLNRIRGLTTGIIPGSRVRRSG